MSKWWPKFFCKRPDGGKDSGVDAFFLIEWKPVFSIALLRFQQGSREAFHNHAFHALTWWVRGCVKEETLVEDSAHPRYLPGPSKLFSASFWPKFTPRNLVHKIVGLTKTSWALTFRGPWNDEWYEVKRNQKTTLTHGRQEVGGLE